ncbi:hypothetical protein [uncultured Bacteroides sp.]|uniref:hypothetical protein n=1 Tax=uncultured Bacteroides sp. TaxID=162156 RepID=UPI0025977DA7|nr:hypothetical protein [uncultured Bacteroides sp.]
MFKYLQTLKIIDYFQYFMLYCMICFGGGSIPFRLSQDTFLIFVLFTSIIIISRRGHILRNITSSYVHYLTILFIAYLLIVITSTLTLGTALFAILALAVIYATFLLNPNEFLNRLIQIILFLSLFSLMMFVLTRVLGFNTMVGIFHPISAVSIARGSESIYSYNFYIYSFVVQHQHRNCGPFGEPGQYQCILSAALFFTLFHLNKVTPQYRIWAMIVFVFTIITTQSTTGYISLVVIITAYYIHCNIKKIVDKKIKNAFKYLLLFGGGFFIFTSIGHQFIETTIYSKFDFSSKEIKASGTARQEGIEEALKVITQQPETLWGVGYDHPTVKSIKSESGLLIYLMAVGVIPFFTLYFYLIRTSFKYSFGIYDAVAKLLVLLNMSLGQPHLINPLLFSMIMYPFFISYRGNNKK